MFVWLGDAAYIDSPDHKFETMSAEYAQGQLARTKTAQGYNKLKHIVGIWDDHDFGANNGGSELVDRERNREIYLDFIDEPVDSERRTQRGTPIHQNYFIQTAQANEDVLDAKIDEILVHLILLDGRFEYDKLSGRRLD